MLYNAVTLGLSLCARRFDPFAGSAVMSIHGCKWSGSMTKANSSVEIQRENSSYTGAEWVYEGAIKDRLTLEV